MSKNLTETAKIVQALQPVAISSVTPAYVSMKNASHATIIINGSNNSTGAASAIALQQATDVSGTGAKALAFDTMWANTNTAAGDTLVKTNVAANTFNTTATASKNYQYVIEVRAEDLDTTNSFDCFSVTMGNAANTTASVTYILTGISYPQATPPSQVID